MAHAASPGKSTASSAQVPAAPGTHVDYISEIGNRQLWNQNTGGRYSDSSE